MATSVNGMWVAGDVSPRAQGEAIVYKKTVFAISLLRSLGLHEQAVFLASGLPGPKQKATDTLLRSSLASLIELIEALEMAEGDVVVHNLLLRRLG